MERNNGLKRKKFEEQMARQAKNYRRQGMSEEKIQEVHEFDEDVYNGDRREEEHTQPLEKYMPGMEEEGRNSLLLRFWDQFTTEMEPDKSDPFWWIDTLENEKLISAVKSLSDTEKMLVTLVIINGWSAVDAVQCLGINVKQSAAYTRIEKTVKKLRKLMGVEE